MFLVGTAGGGVQSSRRKVQRICVWDRRILTVADEFVPPSEPVPILHREVRGLVPPSGVRGLVPRRS